MAKETLPLSDKGALVSVPDRTARVQRLRATPQEIQLTHVIRQEKAK